MINMKKKITDISNYKHEPQKYYKGLVTEIEGYIERYSTEIKENDLTRIIPDEELTKEEKEIAKEIGKIITTTCQEYKKGNIGVEEITTITGNILYSKYRPHSLYRMLNRQLYDFLEKTSEFDFYSSNSELQQV